MRAVKPSALDGKESFDFGEKALEKCKHWIVLEPLVYVMPKADPKQTAKDKLGQYGKGEIVEGDGVRQDGVRWLKTNHQGQEAWILIDGLAVGVDRLFMEPVPG
mmetsp:Transcript_119493/g.168077  ORF Transcript_119493/g.168077 Transcript_119493/m.168077 type:complete len:104 (-) Transcript_119493:7-318(-)